MGHEEEGRSVEERMKELEENPPERLEDWPKDREMRNATFGGPEGEHGYDEGPETKLGPSEVVHHEDGSVTVAGEQVDDPSQFKGERIGPTHLGPTDPSEGRPDGEA